MDFGELIQLFKDRKVFNRSLKNAKKQGDFQRKLFSDSKLDFNKILKYSNKKVKSKELFLEYNKKFIDFFQDILEYIEDEYINFDVNDKNKDITYSDNDETLNELFYYLIEYFMEYILFLSKIKERNIAYQGLFFIFDVAGTLSSYFRVKNIHEPTAYKEFFQFLGKWVFLFQELTFKGENIVFEFSIEPIKWYAFIFLEPNVAIKYLYNVISQLRIRSKISERVEDENFINEIKKYIDELEKINKYTAIEESDNKIENKSKKIINEKKDFRFIKGDKYDVNQMEQIYYFLKEMEYINCDNYAYFEIWENGKPIIWKSSVSNLYLFIHFLIKSEKIKLPNLKGNIGIPAIIESGNQFFDEQSNPIINVTNNTRKIYNLIKTKHKDDLDKEKKILYDFFLKLT
jgi:hypothetical protein